MRKRNKSLVNSLEDKISELKQEIINLKKEKKKELNNSNGIISNEISLFAASEELDFFLLNLENQTVKSLTPKQSVFSNYSDIELISFDTLIAEEDNQDYYYAINSLKEKPFIKIQIKINIPTKELKPVELSLINLSEEQNKALLVLKDISKELKQKKDLIRTKEKIEESDKLKSTILSNISHFIRTPLNSVTGFAELLANIDTDQKKRQEYTDIIKRQSKRILSLIDDLSEIAKLETGNIVLSSNPCNLNLILNELLIGINQQRTDTQRELVSVRLDTPPGKGLELITDSGRLQQIITNLINYSLRYTQKGNIQIGYRLDEAIQKVIFFIKDTSSGLTKDEQKSIFNKFTILDSAESSKYEDPGLGLTIAKNLIKNLGGKIWVESVEGKGNEFFFTLPYEHVTVEETTNIEEEFSGDTLYQWSNKVILIVDDEEINAKFIDAVLQGTSVQVLFAKNGQEAIELCKSINKIDLILMDLKMPVMNGIKATSEIRKFNNSIPIIAQTALASEEDKQESLKAGCSDIITKPIEVQELLYKVNKFLAD